MNAHERRVMERLLGALAERFSRTGHVLQQIEWENRGHCPPGACCLRCTTYVELLHDACDLLGAPGIARLADPERREAAHQVGLFDEGVA